MQDENKEKLFMALRWRSAFKTHTHTYKMETIKSNNFDYIKISFYTTEGYYNKVKNKPWPGMNITCKEITQTNFKKITQGGDGQRT